MKKSTPQTTFLNLRQAKTFQIPNGVGKKVGTESIREGSIDGGEELAGIENIEKAAKSPTPKDFSRRGRAKETTLSEAQSLEMIQQAILTGKKSGMMIGHKAMQGIARGKKMPVLLIELWQVAICHRCKWFTYEGKCHNPKCNKNEE